MDHTQIAKEIGRNKDVFKNLFQGLSKEQYLWKPKPDKWCLLEIVCHLYDEEREDFRARIQHILHDPEQPLPSIDPQGWVTTRKYIEQDYEIMLYNFLLERENSVAYLNGLTVPKWDNTYQHPKLGPMPASLFLHNWLAHRYLHFRQITGTKYLYLKEHSTDPLNYAGDW